MDGDLEGPSRNTANPVVACLIRLRSHLRESRRSADYRYPHSRRRHAPNVDVGSRTFESHYSPVRDESGDVVGLIGVSTDITERKQAEKTMRDLAIVEERNRMAREIHDTLAQGFTGIVLQLEAAEQALEDGSADIEGHIGSAKSLARENLQEARRSVWDLLPKSLEERSLDDAIRHTVDSWSDQGHETTSFALLGEPRELPPEVQTALLRICQESLTNVRRHAGATEVKVELKSRPNEAYLRVQDNGEGFDPEGVKATGEHGGFGLAGMEQRANILGGTLSVQSRRGEGTLVEVKIPLA